MTKIEISEDEKILLKEHFKTTPLVLIRLKSSALLMRTNGMKLKNIADVVSRSEKTAGEWIRDWNERRMASIFTGHQNNGNAGRLTQEQKEEVKEALSKAPSEYGIPKGFWDVPALKKYISAAFQTVYESDRSYHFLLSFGNLSFKYPDTFDIRRNETVVTERMAEIRKEITPLLKSKRWEVFASDEVRMELEALTRKAWLKRGERTILKVDRKREAQSYIGFLNQKNSKCHLYEMPWQNQGNVLKATVRLLKLYPKKNICIVWDNARFHKGKEIQKALRKGGFLERVHLINLPPYAPDHNPIEHVWNIAKGSMANIQYESFQVMKKTFKRHIGGRKFEYGI
jgi:transposase